MTEVSPLRLWILRGMYLFLALGIAVFIWPGLARPAAPLEVMEGQAFCMVAAFSLLCLLGVRYPLQMLPVLLWEMLWKTLWLVRVPLTQWLNGSLDESLAPAVFANGLVVLVYLAVPWKYLIRHYLRAPAERWR